MNVLEYNGVPTYYIVRANKYLLSQFIRISMNKFAVNGSQGYGRELQDEVQLSPQSW